MSTSDLPQPLFCLIFWFPALFSDAHRNDFHSDTDVLKMAFPEPSHFGLRTLLLWVGCQRGLLTYLGREPGSTWSASVDSAAAVVISDSFECRVRKLTERQHHSSDNQKV